MLLGHGIVAEQELRQSEPMSAVGDPPHMRVLNHNKGSPSYLVEDHDEAHRYSRIGGYFGPVRHGFEQRLNRGDFVANRKAREYFLSLHVVFGQMAAGT